MRIGAFPLWTGSRIGGIATYDTELLPALADTAPEHDFHIYSPSQEAIQRLGTQRANVHHHLLFPRSRWINVPISFPIAAAFAQPETEGGFPPDFAAYLRDHVLAKAPA